jgi:hypothetical protein
MATDMAATVRDTANVNFSMNINMYRINTLRAIVELSIANSLIAYRIVFIMLLFNNE